MDNLRYLAFAACLAPLFPLAAAAQQDTLVPDQAFYLGLGGAFATNDFGTQDVYAVGTANVYDAGTLTATGTAAGPAPVEVSSESGLAPSIQAGYFHKLSGGAWLVGGKFSYSYLNSSSSVQDIRLPQAGSFTYTASGETVPFEGNAVARNFKSTIKQQMALIPYVGRTFKKGFFYAGAGPTFSETQTDIDGLVGFADINGNRQDISGAPQNFSDSDWVYGGAATVGLTYFLDSAWFIDASYTYANTRSSKANFSSTYQSTSASGAVTDGTLVGNSTGNVITQSVVVSLNMAF